MDEPAVNTLKQQSRDKPGSNDKKKSWNKKKEKSDGQGPSLTARLESGLCHAHWVYGESATTCHNPCTWQGNGKGGGKLNAISPGHLLHLRDQLSGRHFLVDTGATYLVFPHRSSAPPSGPALTGPGGQAISTWGEREIPLSFDSQHFIWSFLLAAVQFPILGMDFLQQHGLLANVGKHQLIMTASMKVIRAVAPSGGPGGVSQRLPHLHRSTGAFLLSSRMWLSTKGSFRHPSMTSSITCRHPGRR